MKIKRCVFESGSVWYWWMSVIIKLRPNLNETESVTTWKFPCFGKSALIVLKNIIFLLQKKREIHIKWIQPRLGAKSWNIWKLIWWSSTDLNRNVQTFQVFSLSLNSFNAGNEVCSFVQLNNRELKQQRRQRQRKRHCDYCFFLASFTVDRARCKWTGRSAV